MVPLVCARRHSERYDSVLTASWSQGHWLTLQCSVQKQDETLQIVFAFHCDECKNNLKHPAENAKKTSVFGGF